ncbi:hypothetical protein AAMO2058_001256600 [Amorphochlora amoebiformis]
MSTPAHGAGRVQRGNGDIRVGNACPKTCLEFAMRAPRELPEGLRVHEELPETLPIQENERKRDELISKQYSSLLSTQRLELVRAYKGLPRTELEEGAQFLLKFNKEFGYKLVDKALTEEDKWFQDGFGETLHGTDKWGHPISLIKMSKLDLFKLSEKFPDTSKLTAPMARGLCALRRIKLGISAKAGYGVRKHVVIADLSGLSMYSFARKQKYAKALAMVPYQFFPDHVFKILLVNPSAVFNMIWAVAKLWVDEVTLKFVINLGTAERALPLWAKHGISLDCLPKHLGGRSEGVPILDISRQLAEYTAREENLKTSASESKKSRSESTIQRSESKKGSSDSKRIPTSP